MRAYLKISAKNCMIPLDHRDQLIKIVHQWLGWELLPTPIPPHSFSRFEGARNSINGISFMDDTAFFFSSSEAALVKKLAESAKVNPALFNGLKVTEIKTTEDPDLSKRELFYAASPLLLQTDQEPTTSYIVFNDKGAEHFLKAHTKNKLKAAGIEDDSFNIGFDKNYMVPALKR